MIGEILKKSGYVKFHIFKFVYLLFGSKKLKSYKNKYKGETILVVANGPSLKITPLDKFRIPSVGMNKIDLLFDKTKWRPNFIVCINGLVTLQNKKIFKKLAIPVILDIKSFFLGAISKNISYFLPNYKTDFSNNFTKNVGTSGTVTYSAIQFAYYLGAKKIILVGLDHSFKGYSNNKVKSKIEKFKGDDDNHFDPNYFKNKKWAIPDLEGSEIGYKKALTFLNENNIEIYDATINGKLNIFPKITIEQAIKM